ncbi:MAG: DNA recombination protein RmuC [Chitinivibrionales bacterium]|nr:DNA recombination protein RmuC [Chitinivibrionales bacterium]
MEPFILAALIILIILTSILIFKKQTNKDFPSQFDASLNEKFLSFQTELNKSLASTREEVVRSKDMVSDHALKTLQTIKDMGGTIHKIVQQQENAQKLGQSLKDLLAAPKLRGNYGETILEEMLDRILPQGIWEKQYLVDGRERVDAAILYRDIVIPIDAKFPRDDYQRYLSASTEAEKSKCWRDYENAVRIQIRSIGTKYIKPEKGTAEFALMFIPSEAIYYETIAEKNHLGDSSRLYEYAQQNNVLPVSPNTFYAFLQIIIYGVRNIEIIKSAKKLQNQLKQMQKSFDGFYKKYEDIGKNLTKASESFRIGDDHILRYKQRLDNAVKLEVKNDEEKALPEEGDE